MSTAYADTVETVTKTVAAVDDGVATPGEVALPGNPGGGGDVAVVDTGDTVTRPARLRSAVVGYIRITWQVTAGIQQGPSYTLSGALYDQNQWSCSGSGGTTSYTVSCVPVALPVGVTYHCDVLHADIAATSPGASGRTSLDCDSDGVPEARTGQVFGPAGYDTDWAVDTRVVTAFTCTVDLAVPNVTAGCGDPGLVGVE